MTGRPNSGPRRRVATLALALVLGLALAAYYAPKFLAYADSPVKSDVVVLFLGPDFKVRQMEARKLIEDGYAQYLLIPTVGKVWKNLPSVGARGGMRGKLSIFAKSFSEGLEDEWEKPPPTGKPFFENTHLEILEAKRLMEEHGLKSALFVSSPWHMRRIKIIAEGVFNENGKYSLSFVPTRFEKLPVNLSGLCKYAYRSIIKEYLKIMAFLVYSYLGA